MRRDRFETHTALFNANVPEPFQTNAIDTYGPFPMRAPFLWRLNVTSIVTLECINHTQFMSVD